MAVTKVVSAKPVKHNGGTVLNGGNTTSNTLSLSDNMYHQNPTVYEAVSPDSSGNVGTVKALSTGIFGSKMSAGNYVAKGLTGQTLAGAVNYSVYSTCAHHTGRQAINRFKGYQRLDITSWNATTGAATYGVNRGVTVLASGIDGKTGQAADEAANPTAAIPGELTYHVKGTSSTSVDYSARTLF